MNAPPADMETFAEYPDPLAGKPTVYKNGEKTMYNLTSPEPFPALQIQPPAALDSEADYTQLYLYLISEFRGSINAYANLCGYDRRQRLLAALGLVLRKYMPRVEPELVSGYPGSLEKIEMLAAQSILLAVRVA